MHASCARRAHDADRRRHRDHRGCHWQSISVRDCPVPRSQADVRVRYSTGRRPVTRIDIATCMLVAPVAPMTRIGVDAVTRDSDAVTVLSLALSPRQTCVRYARRLRRRRRAHDSDRRLHRDRPVPHSPADARTARRAHAVTRIGVPAALTQMPSLRCPPDAPGREALGHVTRSRDSVA
jgi:hypothetical protein